MIDLVKRDVTYLGDTVTDNNESVWIRVLKQHQIKLYSRDGTFLSNLEHITTKASWDWNRIGGCGSGQFVFRESWDGVIAGSFTEDAEIRVVIKDDAGDDITWYSGSINRVTPTITGKKEELGVLAIGYINKLKKYIVKDQSYFGNEISTTAKEVIDTFIVPNTSITSTSSDYDITGFSADRLDFNESVYDVLQKLSNIAGKVEWGVRADKSFFFKKESTSVSNFFFISEDFSTFKPKHDFDPIITRLYLQGGEGYNARFTVSNKTILNEVILQNSSITTQSVGQQYARIFLKKNGKPKRSYSADLPNKEQRIEETIPIGLAAVNLKLGINIKYDIANQKYDSGLKYDGGTETFQIERIRYTLKDDKMNINISFGPIPEGLSEELTKIESQITNERNI